ncbi:MAG: gliding motility protein GldL [Paludibacteraceae bacterium]|nr:gliding motility protein GldL [Paludibacteraceae bacterium]
MATEKATNQGFGARFFHWYESYQGKNVVNIVYSAGASVVIIGALFKILHWPGASQVLMVGMFTEAFLFLIGTLEHPHPEFHWENVFPQLLEFGTKPELLEEKSHQARPTLLGAGVAGEPTAAVTGMSAGVPTAAPTSAKVPSLKDEDVQALKDGIADLAKTASQLSELNKVAASGVKLNDRLVAAEAATMEYTSKITAVGFSTDSLAKATDGLSGSYAQIGEDIKAVAEETKAYKQGVELVGKNIASLNSVYELQLQAVNAQVEAQKSAAASAKEAAEAQLAFANGTKQLQKHVADLNAIYGNMLNALA